MSVLGCSWVLTQKEDAKGTQTSSSNNFNHDHGDETCSIAVKELMSEGDRGVCLHLRQAGSNTFFSLILMSHHGNEKLVNQSLCKRIFTPKTATRKNSK